MAQGDKKPVIMEADIGVEGGVPPYLHASQHSASGTDPITPHMIGAKSNENLGRNCYFADPIDQRGGWVVKPDAPYYVPDVSGVVDNTDTYYKVDSWAGTTGASNAYFYKDGIKYVVDTAYCVRGYVGTGYGIDGWRGNNAVVLLHDGEMEIIGTSVYGNISEKIEYEQYVGKTVTLSALITGGTGIGQGAYLNIGYKSGAEISKYITETGIVSLTFTLPEDSTMLRLGLVTSSSTGMSLKSKAAKLELGPVQTLAHQDADGNWVLNDPPPDKGMELLKCCMSTADPSDAYANNKLTPAAINAVNKAGDETTGLMINTLDGVGRASFVGNGDAGFIEAFQDDYNVRRQLFVNNIAANANDGTAIGIWNSATNVVHRILHTGNKPSGSYTGNGDATARTIEIGGLGNILMIWAENGSVSFVVPNGVYSISASGFHASGNATFADNVLTISTADSILNANGVIYHYQVL